MRLRVVLVVVCVAVALHVVLFVALGRIAKNKGPLIPSIAPATAKQDATAPSPTSPSLMAHPVGLSESTKVASPLQPRKTVNHLRRARHMGAAPAESGSRLPVFELNPESPTSTDAPASESTK
jgi:hypothetical protein